MIEFVLTGIVVTLATWALGDIYFYSLYFERIRRYGRSLERADQRWKSILGYGLNCRYCLNHWIAAALILTVLFFPTRFGKNLTLLEAAFLAAIVPRLALLIHENVLRPITYADENREEPNES